MSAQVSFVLSQFTRLTDRQTDGQTDGQTFRSWLRPLCMQRGKICKNELFPRLGKSTPQAMFAARAKTPQRLNTFPPASANIMCFLEPATSTSESREVNMHAARVSWCVVEEYRNDQRRHGRCSSGRTSCFTCGLWLSLARVAQTPKLKRTVCAYRLHNSASRYSDPYRYVRNGELLVGL